MSIRIEIKEENQKKRKQRKDPTTVETTNSKWIDDILEEIHKKIQSDENIRECFLKVGYFTSSTASMIETNGDVIMLDGMDALVSLMHHEVEAIVYYVYEYDIREVPKDDATLLQYLQKAIDEYIRLTQHYDNGVYQEIAISVKIIKGITSMYNISDETNRIFTTLAKATFEYACKHRDKIVIDLKP